MVMTCAAGMGDAALRERLPALWRRIEDAHYSYLETDDSPEKLQQKKKLEDYIIEYLSLVPHECKFGLPETSKVFQRTVNELPEFSAYRAGLGWAALARYAGNLLAQPWRKEYKVIRLYCGYFKHEVEANMVGAETLLHAMGYKPAGAGRLALDAPICPDMVAAISRDALVAQCECQIMSQVWEAVWGGGARVSWADVCRERAARASDAAAAAARLAAAADGANVHGVGTWYGLPSLPLTVLIFTVQCMQRWLQLANEYPVSWADVCRERAARASDAAAAAARLAAAADGANVHGSEIYSNIPVTVTDIHHRSRLVDTRYPRYNETSFDEPLPPMHPPYAVPPHLMYPLPHDIPVTVTSQLVMTPYGVPYYYPVQAPYMIPTPVYAPIKQATNVPINGYPPTTQYNRYPSVPTAQLIELDSPSVYENGRFDKHRDDDRSHRRSRQPESSRRNSTSKSGFSDVSLPSLPRSDTQPALSKAREDGMGTYESWDYVFRNLSSKEQDGETRSRYSPSLDRDSRTLDRLDREERRAKYQPTTLDLEDGLQALNIDRSYDEDAYRTAKVNENLMRLKQEQELKRAKQLARKQMDERKPKKLEPIKSDALISTKVAPDKVKLLSKKDVKDRKEVIKQQSSMNGSVASVEAKKVRKPAKLVAAEAERPLRPAKPLENGHSSGHSSKTTPAPPQANYDLKAQLIVSLDEPDARRSPPRPVANGDPPRPASAAKRDRWECSTCTYLNKDTVAACEMCGKSKRGPEIQPLTSGGRECPACTLVNRRDARVCDACGTSLDHCPTYI